MPDSIQRVCVHFPRFGPLHLNRMRAAHEVLGRHGIEAVALEVASNDGVYAWREERGPTQFHRETLFPDQSYDAVSPGEMHRAVTEALDRLQPDAVDIHSYSTPDAQACLAWCRRNRRVAICMAESTARDAPRSLWREAIKRVLASQFDSAQTSGTRSRAYAEALGLHPDRIFRGYSVVDNAYFAERAEAARRAPEASAHLPGLDDRAPFFFASARFIERKDLPTLLEGYRRYREQAGARGALPWRLVLLGEGVLRPALEAQVGRGIEGVTFAGWQQIDVLPAYYGLASAFVHTALVDQWGLVVNEAMASGLPVIVSTGAGCSDDLVEEGANGFTFSPRDPATLAERLYTVAHEADRAALAARSLEIIREEWPLRRFGESLYDAALAGRATSDRGLNPRAAILIGALKRLARTPRSFHSVES